MSNVTHRLLSISRNMISLRRPVALWLHGIATLAVMEQNKCGNKCRLVGVRHRMFAIECR